MGVVPRRPGAGQCPQPGGPPLTTFPALQGSSGMPKGSKRRGSRRALARVGGHGAATDRGASKAPVAVARVLPLLGSVDPQEGDPAQLPHHPDACGFPRPQPGGKLHLEEGRTLMGRWQTLWGRICWASAGRPPAQEALHCHHPGWPPGLLATRLRGPACVFPSEQDPGRICGLWGANTAPALRMRNRGSNRPAAAWPESRLIQLEPGRLLGPGRSLTVVVV